ncbi:hypothetical protein ASPWEDRAFT_476338 [Aspergillus wentii DTO 134E9]|uniref:Mid2 domain-containing protein n=1 Tax=Aspergillus wentii DTO 134E9 TaxID=1073089 RepID=A0A1L9RIL8_ASPWE|nr:uncharacterized protein ASPWEDRAFT_476338 [Aspergillus wentii DTO 134E9]KAI9932269.1 hypothetical protein MW887_009780 [Aspergillus wentii]OJJ34769.1 hypothetical protein ASPWEDRAFT_476338 [Aspergillus wentii DTO 134E9]
MAFDSENEVSDITSYTDDHGYGVQHPDGSSQSTSVQPGDSAETSSTSISTPAIASTTLTSYESDDAFASPTSSPSTDPASSGSGGMATKTKIAIAVPVAVVGAAIILLVIFLLMRWRNRRQRNALQAANVEPSRAPEAAFVPQEEPRWSTARSPTHDMPFEGPLPGQAISQNYQMDIVPDQTSRPRSQPLDSNPYHAQAGLAVTTMPEHEAENSRTALTERNVASNETSHNLQRPQSPFADPHDDAISQISGVSGGRQHRQTQDEMDDVSSVSSFNDDDRGPDTHNGIRR